MSYHELLPSVGIVEHTVGLTPKLESVGVLLTHLLYVIFDMTFLHKDSPWRYSFLCSHVPQQSRSFLLTPINIRLAVTPIFSIPLKYWRCVRSLHLALQSEADTQHPHLHPGQADSRLAFISSPQASQAPEWEENFLLSYTEFCTHFLFAKQDYEYFCPLTMPYDLNRVTQKLTFPFDHQSK